MLLFEVAGAPEAEDCEAPLAARVTMGGMKMDALPVADDVAEPAT